MAMKIKKSTNKKKLIIVLILALLLIGGGFAVYAYRVNQQQAAQDTSSQEEKRLNDISLDPPTEEEIKAGNETKKQTTENEGQPTTPPDTLNVTLTATNKNGELFQVRSLISKLSSGGTCELKMTKDSAVITKTASVQALASSSTCQGFDVPISELSSGTWKLILTVTIDGISGQATKDVEI